MGERDKIEACPFCRDGDPLRGPRIDGEEDCGAVSCEWCGARGSQATTRAAAIEAWNRVASLRSRADDLELLLRAALDRGETGKPWIKKVRKGPASKAWTEFEILHDYDSDGWSVMRMRDVADGLPALPLTPEARAALKRGES